MGKRRDVDLLHLSKPIFQDEIVEYARKYVPSLTIKSFTLALILIPINAYWIMMSCLRPVRIYPTDVALFFNVVIILLVLTALSLFLRKVAPKLALTQGELLTVYTMLCISSAIAGHDRIQILIPLFGHSFWFASPENDWASLFHNSIPRWLVVDQKPVLEGYYTGFSTLYTVDHIRAWLRPVLMWSSFIIVLVFIQVCINSVIRKQWVETEKLTYPIIQIPLEMTKPNTSLFRNRIMWIGFAIACSLDLINGTHFLHPQVPSIGGKLYDVSKLFADKPWTAMGWTPVAVFPFGVGLAFFIPLDLSLSCWFFYLFWKVERIMGAAAGWRALPRFPYADEQSHGAYIGLCMIALWTSRFHLIKVLKKIFGRKSELDDSAEPMRYRMAVLGIIGGMGFLTLFSYSAGMSLWLAPIFFTIWYLLAIAITRMRAEVGSPVHDLHYMGPDTIIPEIIGTRRLGTNNLTMFSFYHFINRAHRCHPMPHQLEGFKLAEKTGIDNRKLFYAMVIAIVLGTLSGFWAYLHVTYKTGATLWRGREIFGRLDKWINNPVQPDSYGLSFIGIGMVFSVILMAMRKRFFWWPLHPAGYAVSGSWAMNPLWFSIFVGWLLKWIILRYGGLRAHRKAIPFFMGLVLGEFAAGTFWSVVGSVAGWHMFKFLWF